MSKNEQGLVAELVRTVKILHDLYCPDGCGEDCGVKTLLARATPEAVRTADAAPELYEALNRCLADKAGGRS